MVLLQIVNLKFQRFVQTLRKICFYLTPKLQFSNSGYVIVNNLGL